MPALLKTLRAREQDRMRSSCTLLRPSGEATWDDTLGEYVRTDDTVYQGPCLLESSQTGREVDAAGREVVVTAITLVLPPDVDVDVGDVAVIDSSPDLEALDRGGPESPTAVWDSTEEVWDDPYVAYDGSTTGGIRLRVRDVPVADFTPNRRVPVEREQ